MRKNLAYYLGLPYRVEVQPISPKKGGGYLARLPQFGALGVVGDGETPEEARQDLQRNMKQRFCQYLEEGLTIPESDDP